MINEYKDLLENFSKIYKESNKQTIFRFQFSNDISFMF